MSLSGSSFFRVALAGAKRRLCSVDSEAFPVPPHPCLSAKCLAYSVHGTFIATSHTIWFPPLADRIGGAKWCKKSICLIGTAGSARIGTSGEVKISPARHPSIALMRHNRRTARTAQRMNDPCPFCGTPRPDLQDHE